MFKTYLHYHNKALQLVILLSIWSALFLIGIYAQTLFIQKSAGVSSEELSDFLSTGLYEQPQLIFVSNAIFQIVAFLLPACIFAYLASPQPVSYLGLTFAKRPAQLTWVLVAGIALVFFMGILGSWMQQIDFGAAINAIDEQRKRVVELYLQSGSLLSLLRNLLLIALLPAICEEVFFRGILQKFAYSFTGKWWLSILITALIFTLFHASFSEFLPILLAGIILGTVYYLTGSLWMCILLHFINNGLQVGIAYFNKGAQQDDDLSIAFQIAYFLVATLVLAFSLWQLYRNNTSLPADWSVAYGADTSEQDEFDDQIKL